jgi:hypothetical protein
MSSNWWAQKLNSGPNSTPPTTPPRPVVQMPEQPVQQQEERRMPPSAVQDTRCPGCGGSNYGGTAETRPRCYDCGYPITQSGSGVRGVSQPTGGPVQPAKQVSTANNFNPQGIIGRI